MGIVAVAGGDELEVVRDEDALDRADDARHERVRDVRDEQPDRRARPAAREGACQPVGSEAELPGRREDARPRSRVRRRTHGSGLGTPS